MRRRTVIILALIIVLIMAIGAISVWRGGGDPVSDTLDGLAGQSGSVGEALDAVPGSFWRSMLRQLLKGFR